MTLHPSWLDWPETRQLLDVFQQAGVACRFVGGCVRDALLERAVTDLDLATPSLPEMTIGLLKQAGITAIPTGIAHGTITAVMGGHHFEITTLRKDVDCDGRHATVEYTDDWQQDAARRDFTMNALYMDASGAIEDFFGGEEDARAGRVKFIGDAAMRIREDALRILRFFRFYAHYGMGKLDAAGLAACAAEAARIDALSGERIQTEMFKLLRAPDPLPVLEAMRTHDILPHVLPAQGLEPLARLLVLEVKLAMPRDTLRRVAMLLYHSDDGVAWVSERWKLSNADRKRLRLLAVPAMALQPDSTEAEQKKAIRALGKADFIDSALLASAASGENYEAMIALAKLWEAPEFPVNGEDLIKAGIAPGKALGEALKRLETEWENSGYQLSKPALMARLK